MAARPGANGSALRLTAGVRLFVGLLLVGSLLPGMPARAADPDAGGRAQQTERQALRLARAAEAVQAAAATANSLRSHSAGAAAVDQLRADLKLDQAEFQVREAVRNEQRLVYDLAKQPAQEAAVRALLSAPHTAGVGDATAALRATWRLVEIDDLTLVHPRLTHRFDAAEPVGALLGYYRAAAARTGLDWTYLAALNFIESDFGRVNGPSSAGALGPMQFLPSTWQEYGGAGDVMMPRDAIQGAALLLARNGAPADYDRALFRYNHDLDYVAAVKAYAAALRADSLWLTRLYYWSTFG